MFVKREEREEVMQCVHRHRVHTGMYTDTAYIQVCTQTPRIYRYIHRHRVHTGIYTDTAYIQVYTQCLTSFAVIENPQQLMVPLCSGRLVVVKEQGRMRIGGCPLRDLYQYSIITRCDMKSVCSLLLVTFMFTLG